MLLVSYPLGGLFALARRRPGRLEAKRGYGPEEGEEGEGEGEEEGITCICCWNMNGIAL